MNTSERRKEILKTLRSSDFPVAARELAAKFGVSRQVIVQDMALIRAKGHEIISTNRGYLLCAPLRVSRTVKVFHSNEEIEEELYSIVDLGGIAEDVFVHHKVYGTLRADLHIASRRDVQRFTEDIKNGKSSPLKEVTSGYHYHTISADSEETLDLIEKELKEKGFLL